MTKIISEFGNVLQKIVTTGPTFLQALNKFLVTFLSKWLCSDLVTPDHGYRRVNNRNGEWRTGTNSVRYKSGWNLDEKKMILCLQAKTSTRHWRQNVRPRGCLICFGSFGRWSDHLVPDREPAVLFPCLSKALCFNLFGWNLPFGVPPGSSFVFPSSGGLQLLVVSLQRASILLLSFVVGRPRRWSFRTAGSLSGLTGAASACLRHILKIPIFPNLDDGEHS